MLLKSIRSTIQDAVAPPRGRINRRLWWAGLILVLGGLVYRVHRYVQGFPIWGDEAMLAMNFFERSWGRLTEPLEFVQIAPIGYLWILNAMKLAFGVEVWAFRLVALVAGVVALLMFAKLVSGLGMKREGLLALAILAASYYSVRLAAEIKPYSLDLAISIGLLWMGLVIFRKPERIRGWVVLGGVGGAMMWFSFPASLTAGGMMIFLAWSLWRDQAGRRIWMMWLITGAWLGLMLIVVVRMHQSMVPDWVHDHYWNLDLYQRSRPPLEQPWLIPWWLIKVHAGEMLAYPVGGKNFGSSATLFAVIIGIWTLWRDREKRWMLVWLLVTPILGIIAAAAYKYPYGEPTRVMLYLAPQICLLMGIGGMTILRRIIPARYNRPVFQAALSFYLLLIVLGMGRDAFSSSKSNEDVAVRQIITDLADQRGPGTVWFMINPRVKPESYDYWLDSYKVGHLTIWHTIKEVTVPVIWSNDLADLPEDLQVCYAILIGYPPQYPPPPHIERTQAALLKKLGPATDRQHWQFDDQASLTIYTWDRREEVGKQTYTDPHE